MAKKRRKLIDSCLMGATIEIALTMIPIEQDPPSFDTAPTRLIPLVSALSSHLVASPTTMISSKGLSMLENPETTQELLDKFLFAKGGKEVLEASVE